MIILDIETSGIDIGRCGIWQIGAIEFENPKNQFLEEARIDDEDLVKKEAITVTGKTENEMRDPNKKSQKELILKFLEWAKSCKDRIIIGHNIGWDVNFIQNKCIKYNIHDQLRKTIGFKGLDTYSIAQLKHLEKKGNFAIKEDGRGNMNMRKMLDFCGIQDNRIDLEGTEVIREGKPHNALEDAKLTAECFSRLIYGKNLFPEFAKFPIPEELKK